MAELSRIRKALASRFTEPVVRLLSKTPITPSNLTWFGFLLTIGAAVLIARDLLLAAGLVVLVAGFFDTLDGALARHTNRVTIFGAVLDSTLDRLSESALLIGILVLYAGEPSIWPVLLVGVTLVGSLAVSYIRARAEALDLECQVGWFTRTERVIVLALGLLLDQLVIALAVIAVFSFVTVFQRLFHVWRKTRVQ
ncbi:MAG: CDP-alcohol phosphatidyltransferase family protein [Dehalococcoidales bacterium]|nr:CDP-alcohol phosphatidyltransferase family protein [Dehalococcoidales bacterium]